MPGWSLLVIKILLNIANVNQKGIESDYTATYIRCFSPKPQTEREYW